MQKELHSGRTSVYNLNYHLIWGTKYRNKVLKGHV
ncbi:IS200/IS605 family transposase, partial [Limosilactobacillus fermentum]